METALDPRFVRESVSEYSELALPNDANGLGNLLGGKIMHLVDLAGAIAAMKHCRHPVVTASVDHMDFIHPVKINQLVRLRASVNRRDYLVTTISPFTEWSTGAKVESPGVRD